MKILVNLGISLLSLLLLLTVFELGFRLKDRFCPPKVLASDRPVFYYKDSLTDSYQNNRYVKNKGPSYYRIATIGDSFTYPHLMQFDDVYPKHLERMLKLRDSDRTELHPEVINYGVAGLSTFAESHYVKKAVADGADMVLLQITLNDPASGSLEEIEQRMPGKYTFSKLQISKEVNPLYYHLKSLGYIATRIHNSKTRDSYIRFHNRIFENPTSFNPFRDAIRAMNKYCKKHERKFAVVLFPLFNFPLDDNYPFQGIHQRISSFLKSEGIPYLDLFDAYKSIPHERLHVIPIENSHPNEIAHRIAAEAIYLWFEEQGLIPAQFFIEKYKVRAPNEVKYEIPRSFAKSVTPTETPGSFPASLH